MILWENKQELQKLLKEVQTSPHSNFYKNKFSSIRKNSELLLEELPFLSRTELAETPPNKRLYIPKKDVSFVAYTSGTTTGGPIVLYWSEVENFYFEPSLGMNVTTLLIVHPALNKNFGHTFIQQCRQAKNRVTPVFADYQNLAQSAVLAGKTEADALYATPTIALMLVEHINKYYDPKRIKLIVLLSENLTRLKRLELHTRYPNAQIANTYGSTEIGQLLFYPCRYIIEKELNEFHVLTQALVALEIEGGELVLTQWQNKAFPLIRYRTSDFFEAVYRKCECGLETPLLSWSGRMEVDKIRVNGVELRSEDLEFAMQNIVRDIGNEYQLHFYSEISPKTKSEVIRIVVEVALSDKRTASHEQQQKISEMVKQELLSHWHISQNATLQSAINSGLFLEPEISFVENLSVKTEKIRRFVNHVI